MPGVDLGLMREMADAVDQDRGHSNSLLTGMLRDAADEIRALRAALESLEMMDEPVGAGADPYGRPRPTNAPGVLDRMSALRSMKSGRFDDAAERASKDRLGPEAKSRGPRPWLPGTEQANRVPPRECVAAARAALDKTYAYSEAPIPLLVEALDWMRRALEQMAKADPDLRVDPQDLIEDGCGCPEGWVTDESGPGWDYIHRPDCPDYQPKDDRA